MPSILTAPAPAVSPASNPRDSWPAWTDADRWTVADVDADEPRPTADDSYAPTPEADAYWAGYTLRLGGEGLAEPPDHFNATRRSQFIIGQIDGFLERLRREREEDAHYDTLYADRMDDAFADPITDFDIYPVPGSYS